MSNQLNVKVVNEKVVFPDSFGGVDTSNLLADKGSGETFTSTEPCVAFCWEIDYGSIKVDDVTVSKTTVDKGESYAIMLAPGTTVKVSSGNGSHRNFKVYGLKY